MKLCLTGLVFLAMLETQVLAGTETHWRPGNPRIIVVERFWSGSEKMWELLKIKVTAKNSTTFYCRKLRF